MENDQENSKHSLTDNLTLEKYEDFEKRKMDFNCEEKVPERFSESENKKSGSTSLNSSSKGDVKNDFLIGSPYFLKFGKTRKSDGDLDDRKYHYDSVSSSSQSRGSSEGKKRRFDTDSYVFKRSKSSLRIRHNFTPFPVVREEKQEEEYEHLSKESIKFKELNLKIMQEGYDNVEDSLMDNKPKLLTARSTKCLSLMDPVMEVKEEIDFNNIKFAPFKKLKFVVDCEEDARMGTLNNQHHFNRFDVDDAIEEDNRENDLENDFKYKKCKTMNIKKIPDFIDKSDQIQHHDSYHPKNNITEEIKEDKEDDEKDNIAEEKEIIMHSTSKKYSFFS